MKKLLTLTFFCFFVAQSFSDSTNTLINWTFDDGTLNAEPITISTNTYNWHIGGDDALGNAVLGWEERKTQGGTIIAPASGTLNFGATAAVNKYYGPVNVPQGSNATTDDPYIYAIPSDQILRLTMKVNHVDYSSTPSPAGNNAFGLRLWDKKNEAWLGLTIQDRNNGAHGNTDRLELNVQSNNGILTGGGIAGNANNWQRIAWITAPRSGAGDLSSLIDSDDVTYALEINYATGTWEAFIDGASETSGTFDKSALTGFDRLQAAFANFDNGDYVTLDEIKIEYITTEAPAIEPLSGWYYSTQNGITSVYNSLTGYNAHTNGNMAVVFNDISGQSSWNHSTDPIVFAASETFFPAASASVPGTNATQITSVWKANTTGTVEYWDNIGGTLANGDSVFIAPGAGDNLKLKSANTELIIDTPVTVASISGEAAGATTLTVNNGGALVVRGNSPLVSTTGSGSGLTYMDSQMQVGAYGTGPGTHSMVVNVDGATTTLDADRISLGHSRASGVLNVSNGASVNVANNFYIGYDSYLYGTGVVNLASGQIDADEVSVGLRGPGELNISGGVFDATTYIRVSSSVVNDGKNAEGTINLSGGILNAPTNSGSGATTYIGYNQTEDVKYGANVNVSGGTFNTSDGIDVGRSSEGTLTISDTGTVNISNSNLSIGHSEGSSGTLNMNGGTLNLLIGEGYTATVPTLNVAGWNGGTGTVSMTGGTMNLEGNLYINNVNLSSNHPSTIATVSQSGGTINSQGGEVRIGGNGEGNYTIGGGDSLATLRVNPTGVITNNAGSSNSSIIMSRTPVNSSFTITNNALVHANSINIEAAVGNAPADGAQAVLNLDGGTLLLEANWTNAIQVANDGQINISGGDIIWAGGEKAPHVYTNLQSYINLTGGLSEVPAGAYNPVFTNAAESAILYAEVYNSSNKVYSAEMQADQGYTRFVSVLANPPSGYDIWAASKSLSDPAGDGDGDGMSNLLEYALDTDPTVSDLVSVSGALSGSNIAFTHAKRAGTDHGIIYTVQTNANLKFPVWGDSSTVSASESGSSVTHTIETATEDALFIRLKVEEE